jgi:hypothetical protein
MDYFSYARRRGNSVNQDRLNAPLPPAAPPGTPRPRPPGSLENLRAPSSIRIRRLPSGNVQQAARPVTQSGDAAPVETDTAVTGRRRSSSEPQRFGSTLAPPAMDLSRQRTTEDRHMPTLTEEARTPPPQQVPAESEDSFHEAAESPYPRTPDVQAATPAPAERVASGASAMQSAGNAARTNRGLRRFTTNSSNAPRNEQVEADEYNSDVVDLLDLVGMYLQRSKW